MVSGTVNNPFELREGETDTFHAICAELLGSADTIAAAPAPAAVSSGVTISSVQANSTSVTIDGVTYAPNTVVSFSATGISLGDKAEVIVTITATSGRGPLIGSVWIEGVGQYGHSG